MDGPSDEVGPPAGVGFGVRDAALPGGKNEPPLPMSPKADEGAWLSGNPDWPALAEFADDVDDVDDDETSAQPEEPAEETGIVGLG